MCVPNDTYSCSSLPTMHHALHDSDTVHLVLLEWFMSFFVFVFSGQNSELSSRTFRINFSFLLCPSFSCFKFKMGSKPTKQTRVHVFLLLSNTYLVIMQQLNTVDKQLVYGIRARIVRSFCAPFFKDQSSQGMKPTVHRCEQIYLEACTKTIVPRPKCTQEAQSHFFSSCTCLEMTFFYYKDKKKTKKWLASIYLQTFFDPIVIVWFPFWRRLALVQYEESTYKT